jgi:GTP1/Obg family GTP-binding protein
MRRRTLRLGKIEHSLNGGTIDGVEIMGMFDDAWKDSVTSPLSDVDIVKKDMKELTKAYYESLKRIKELKEQDYNMKEELKEIKSVLVEVKSMLEKITDFLEL